MQSKERRLKKYEADARAVAVSTADPKMDFYSPFGPMIARTILPTGVVERINRRLDALLTPGQGRELVLSPEMTTEGGVDSLAQHTGRLVMRYLEGVENTVAGKLNFNEFWAISQYAGTPSPVHFHSSDISGVLYLRVPDIESGEESKTYISGRQAGYINFMIGGKQHLSKSLISFKPKVGDFYLFPGWLLHGAEPFRGAGERRSLSFNAMVGEAR